MYDHFYSTLIRIYTIVDPWTNVSFRGTTLGRQVNIITSIGQ